MLRRLRIYFIGFGLGLLMVYILFFRHSERDLDFWTPSQRVLEDIRHDTAFLESAVLTCFTQCLELSEDQETALWRDSKVKSLNPGGNPYRYLISLKTDLVHLEATLEKREDRYSFVQLKSYTNPKTCDCRAKK